MLYDIDRNDQSVYQSIKLNLQGNIMKNVTPKSIFSINRFEMEIKMIKIIKIILTISALTVLFCACTKNQEPAGTNTLEKERAEDGTPYNYICEESSDGYQLTLYSNAGEEILSEIYPKEPIVTTITENLLQISISVGSPATYIYYADIENVQISETFFNPIYLGDGNIAYWENDGLILKDIFDQGLFYQEIKRDFSECADPIGAIIAVELLANDYIALIYYEGESFTEKSEIIALNSTLTDSGDATLNHMEEKRETVEIAEADMLKDKWIQCDLSYDQIPDYYYFTNAGQGHYNLTLENEAAQMIKDYALDTGMEKEEWELKRITYQSGIYQAFAESKTGNELYVLFPHDDESYIIAADIRKGSDAEISLQDERYSYHSMLEWHTYEYWFNGTDKDEIKGGFKLDVIDNLYDSIYENSGYYALYAYLCDSGSEIESDWEIDSGTSYIGRNGYLASVSFLNEEEQIDMLIDVWNKTYAVFRHTKASEAKK